jgi:Zn finger protein HypA/HybF involved in hydrogenase expression
MHDLHVADLIYKKVIEIANDNNFSKVLVININLGTVIEHGAAIDPENLKFNIKMLAKDDLVKNAEIKINEVEGGSWELVSIDGE